MIFANQGDPLPAAPGAVPRNPGVLAWATVPIFVGLLAILWAMRLEQPHVHPLFLLAANVFFLCVTSATVAYLVGRTFLVRGNFGVLLLGCGIVVWGTATVASVAAFRTDINAQITLYNVSALLAGLLHFSGAVVSRGRPRTVRGAGIVLPLAYAAAVGVVILGRELIGAGLLPPFWTPTHGMTEVRQLVLGSAVALFAATAAALLTRNPVSAFTRWYGLALTLVAVGLFGVLIQPGHNTPVSWLGRAVQWLGGLVMLRAAIVSVAESRGWLVSVGAELSERLQVTEQRFREAVDHFPGVYIIYDAERRVQYMNAVGLALAKARLSEVVGKRGEEIWPAEGGAVWLPHLQQTLDTGQTVTAEVTTPESLGRRTFLINHVPMRGAKGELREILTVAVDITERKRAEEALRDAQAALSTHAQQLEQTVAARTATLRDTINELEQFSYAMAHDMRAPLRAMRGYAEVVLEEAGGGGGAHLVGYLERIRRAALRMDQLITGALNYGKTVSQRLPIAPVDLGPILHDLVHTYPNLHPDTATIEVAEPLPRVLGNEAAVAQCFSNLLGNAVKFVPAGTRPHVKVYAERKDDRVRVWVVDNGIGIPPQAQPQLFKMFGRLTTDYEGTGIGLAIVRRVVQNMGGQTGVESDPGQGSRFWVELPAAA